MVWLTPQMERLFQEPPAGRRRFFDRLVWALDPGHAREVAAFETAMAGRNRLLAERRREDIWLAALEDAMARHAVAVTAARLALMQHLNATLTGPATHGFPPVRVTLDDALSARLAEHAGARPSRTGCGVSSPPAGRAMPRAAARPSAATAPT